MARYRKLHVKAVESLDINDMPDDFTRLLWLMLPLGLDREGRGLDNSSWVKAKVMPLRGDVMLAMIEGALAWYAKRGMIVRYKVAGRAYFLVPSWHKYQGATDKEAASEYPEPQELVESNSGVSPELVESNSASDADSYSNAHSDSDAYADSGGVASKGDAPATEGTTATVLQPFPVVERRPAEVRTEPKGDGAFFQALDRAGILVLSPVDGDLWRDVFKEAGDIGFFTDAVREACAANHRELRYVRGIIRKSKEEHRRPGEGAPRDRASPPGKRSAWERGLLAFGSKKEADSGNP